MASDSQGMMGNWSANYSNFGVIGQFLSSGSLGYSASPFAPRISPGHPSSALLHQGKLD